MPGSNMLVLGSSTSLRPCESMSSMNTGSAERRSLLELMLNKQQVLVLAVVCMSDVDGLDSLGVKLGPVSGMYL